MSQPPPSDEPQQPVEQPWPRPDASSVEASRALAERIAAATESTVPATADDLQKPKSRGRLVLILAIVAVTLLLSGTLGVTGYLAVTNKSRADRWQERSTVLERNVSQLNSLLVDRSNRLNSRTGELNRMAIKVRRQESALNRSEADVSSLERRQRELADEKAQVEDSRAQLAVQAATLENVADAFIDCKTGLVDLLGYVLDEDYFSANAVISGVVSDCQYAESALSGYNANYP